MEEFEEKIIQIIKEKNRLREIKKADLLEFLNQDFHLQLPDSTPYSTLLKIAEEQLPNLALFDKLEDFGLSKGEVKEVLEITDSKLEKMVSTGIIRLKKVKEKRNLSKYTLHIYSVMDVINAEQKGMVEKRTRKEFVPINYELTDDNIAQALYIINKSAKVSRDTKNRSYSNKSYGRCSNAKAREKQLYQLKNQVLEKLIAEGRATYLGFHRQFDMYEVHTLKLYQFSDFTFHFPVTNMDDPDLQEEFELGILPCTISAKKSEGIRMRLGDALGLLEKYLENENQNET